MLEFKRAIWIIPRLKNGKRHHRTKGHIFQSPAIGEKSLCEKQKILSEVQKEDILKDYEFYGKDLCEACLKRYEREKQNKNGVIKKITVTNQGDRLRSNGSIRLSASELDFLGVSKNDNEVIVRYDKDSLIIAKKKFKIT